MKVESKSEKQRFKVRRQRLPVSNRREDTENEKSIAKESSDMPVFPHFPQVKKTQLPSGHKRSSEENINYPVQLLSKIAQLVSLSWNS